MNKRLTVFIPTYNRVRFLEKCIRSVLAQTYQDFDLVVLDNASDQDVAGLVNSINDPRISLKKNQVNIGGTGNIQKAFDSASTEFVTVFHDDDYMHPRLLEMQLRIFDEVPELVFVATSCNLVDDFSKLGIFSEDLGCNYDIFKSSSLLIRALITKPFGFGGVMYRSSAMQGVRLDVGRFSIACDRPFLVSLAERGACAYIKEPMYNARQHPTQDSANLGSDERLWLTTFRFYREKLNGTRDLATEKMLNYVITQQLLMNYMKGGVNRQRYGSALLDQSLTQGLIRPLDFAQCSVLVVISFISRRLKRFL